MPKNHNKKPFTLLQKHYSYAILIEIEENPSTLIDRRQKRDKIMKKKILLMLLTCVAAMVQTSDHQHKQFKKHAETAPADVDTKIIEHPVFDQRNRDKVHPKKTAERHNNFVLDKEATGVQSHILKRSRTHIKPEDAQLWEASQTSKIVPVQVCIDAARGINGTIRDCIDLEIDINAYDTGQKLIDAIWEQARQRLQQPSCLHRLNYTYMRNAMRIIEEDRREKEHFINCYIEHMSQYSDFSRKSKLAQDEDERLGHNLKDFQIEQPSGIELRVEAPYGSLPTHPVHYCDTKYVTKQCSVFDMCTCCFFYCCSLPDFLRSAEK